jgi:hypothetical protein
MKDAWDTAARGAMVGLCATQALDWVSIVLYDNEDRATRRAEDTARGHRHVYEVAVERLAGSVGRRLTPAQQQRWGWRFHKFFGVMSGLGYLALRNAFPRLGRWRGLAFGVAFFLVVDELLMPVLRLSPGPRAFSWKVHARGAAAHLAYGVAAEEAARRLVL